MVKIYQLRHKGQLQVQPVFKRRHVCVCVCYFSVHRQTLQIKSKLLQNNFMSEKKVGHFPQGAMIVTFGEIIIQRKRQAYEFLFIYFQKLVCTQLLYLHWEAIAGSC